MRKGILIMLLIISASYSWCQTTAGEMIKSLKDGAAIVRLYMNKPKQDMLIKTINDPKTSATEKIQLQKVLDDHILDRKNYKERVIKTMKEDFDFCKVYFMYDYDQKLLKEGKKTGFFLNENGEVDASIELKENYFLIFGRGSNDDKMVCSNLSGEPIPTAFPAAYNRSIIDVVSFIKSKDKLSDYVKKWNKKFKKFYFESSL